MAINFSVRSTPIDSPDTPTADQGVSEIRSVTAADDEARDALVRSAPGGSFFHLSSWRNFIVDTHGHEPVELGAWRGDELVGVLPLMRCRGLLGKRKLVSIPYSVYGGAVARDPDVVQQLSREGGALAESSGVSYLEMRYEDDPGLDLPGSDLYWTFKRELPEDPEGILKAMPKKSRAEARKARKRHGLELTEGVWYLEDLYRLFLSNKHTLGSPALPPAHFYKLLDAMRDNVHVHLVRRGSEPLAAVMSFAFGDTLIAYYAGTAPQADRAYSASNFMYMALQEWAVERGFKTFDFCRSRGDSGAFRFKVHQGFEPKQLNYRYHLVGASSLPSFTPSNPKTALLRKTWSKMPLWLARRLSSKLSRYLT